MSNKLKPRKLDLKNGQITLSHGSGGKAMTDLIQQLFLPAFENPLLMQQHDSTCIEWPHKQLVIATDSYVVTPLFFPGGNIGDLAVNGTINDLAMSGAMPLYLTVNFILEEGFLFSELNIIVQSIAAAAQRANVKIVTGDTKVVERHKGDGIYISTTGIGYKTSELTIHPSKVQIGDKIIVSGYMGDHGMAVLSKRENLQLASSLQSDTAPLHDLVQSMLVFKDELHCLRDPTRGGVAAALNEIAQAADIGIMLEEAALPIQKTVQSACEIFGLDPLHVANEGKLLAICSANAANDLLSVMQQHPLGKNSAIIGECIHDPYSFVQLKTSFGGERIIDWIYGEQLPRIC